MDENTRTEASADSSEATFKSWRWLDQNRKSLEAKYPGQWIAVANEQIVAVGPGVTEVLVEARAKGYDDPLVAAFRKAEFKDTMRVPGFRLVG